MAAPSSLTATAISATRIDLAWTNNGSYDEIRVRRGTTSGDLSLYDTITGSDTSYSDTSTSTDTRYYYKVVGTPLADHGFSSEASAGWWTATGSETVTWSDAHVQNIVATQSTEETITWTDYHQVSQTIKTNYGYYCGSSDGKVYEYSDSYQSDAGTNILAYYQSKRLDFADQYPEDIDKFKTVHKVQLKYVDMTADTPITVYISGDGGVTWEYVSQTLGSGDEKTKTADFHFMLNSEMFSIKVESSSTEKKFQLLGVYIYYHPCGEYFEI